MPRPGERTIASGRLEGPVVEQELQLIEEEAPSTTPPRRRPPGVVLVALLLAAAAGYFYLGGTDRSFWRAMLDSRRALVVASTVSELSSGLRTWLGPKPDVPPPPAVPSALPSSRPSDPPLSPMALATPEAFDPPEPIFGDSVPAPAPTDSPSPAAVSPPDPP